MARSSVTRAAGFVIDIRLRFYGLDPPMNLDAHRREPPASRKMRSMGWSKLRLSDLAIASLVAVGLFLIAISVPPLYNPIFGEEPSVWSPETVANGAVYLAVAALVARRIRLGVGLAIVLGMLGLTMALGLTLSWLGYGFSNIRT